jgi:hypothetical protein
MFMKNCVQLVGCFAEYGRTMAFPPLVSSTPPPLDNFGESDEDEFGDFTAGGIDGIYMFNFIESSCLTR